MHAYRGAVGSVAWCMYCMVQHGRPESAGCVLLRGTGLSACRPCTSLRATKRDWARADHAPQYTYILCACRRVALRNKKNAVVPLRSRTPFANPLHPSTSLGCMQRRQADLAFHCWAKLAAGAARAGKDSSQSPVVSLPADPLVDGALAPRAAPRPRLWMFIALAAAAGLGSFYKVNREWVAGSPPPIFNRLVARWYLRRPVPVGAQSTTKRLLSWSTIDCHILHVLALECATGAHTVTSPLRVLLWMTPLWRQDPQAGRTHELP